MNWKNPIYLLNDDELGDLKILLHLAIHGLTLCPGPDCDYGSVPEWAEPGNMEAFRRVEEAVSGEIQRRHQEQRDQEAWDTASAGVEETREKKREGNE